jgi:hypothetical protein
MAAVTTRYRCTSCDRYLSDRELKEVGPSNALMKACAFCDRVVTEEASRVVRPLSSVLASAFLFPFRAEMLMWTVAVFVGCFALRFVPLFGGIAGLGIQVGFFFAVLRAAATGHDELRFDIVDRLGWIGPAARFIATSLLAFGPGALAAYFLGADSPAAIGALLLGAAYFPAALVVAAHGEGLGGMNPVTAIRFIARIPVPYAQTLFFLAIAGLAGGVLVWLATSVSVPIVSPVLASFAGLYAPMVMARMLGLLIREHEEEL